MQPQPNKWRGFAASLQEALDDHALLGERTAAELLDKAGRGSGQEAGRLLDAIRRRCACEIALSPADAAPRARLGRAIILLADLKSHSESESLWADAKSAFEAALALDGNSAEGLTGLAVALTQQAPWETEEVAGSTLSQAADLCTRALSVEPSYSRALRVRGRALAEQARRCKGGAEAAGLYEQAVRDIAAALEAAPQDYRAVHGWGVILSYQAQEKSGQEAVDMLLEAARKFEQALTLSPDFGYALGGWGDALRELAEHASRDEADRLLAASIEKYSASLAQRPNLYQALQGWGSALFDQARRRTGPEAERLAALALEKCASALAACPKYPYAASNWGVALAFQARQKPDSEAVPLFAAAGEKFDQALRLRPDFYQSLVRWSFALSAQAWRATGNEAHNLATEAIKKGGAALAIRPGYHLAYEALGDAFSRGGRGRCPVRRGNAALAGAGRCPVRGGAPAPAGFARRAHRLGRHAA